MRNKKEMSQLKGTLTWVPLTLTFDLEFSRSFLPSNRIVGICYILRMDGPIDAKQKGNESTEWHADLGTLDPDLWPSISKVIFTVKLKGNGLGLVARILM